MAVATLLQGSIITAEQMAVSVALRRIGCDGRMAKRLL